MLNMELTTKTANSYAILSAENVSQFEKDPRILAMSYVMHKIGKLYG